MKPHHVGYLVKDMARSVEEFKALGYEVEREARLDEGRGVSIAFVKNAGLRVELVSPEGKESPLYPMLKRAKNAPYHICYMVEDLDAEVLELSAKGYTVVEGRREAPCIEGLPVVFLLHRHMGLIELVEMKEDQWS